MLTLHDFLCSQDTILHDGKRKPFSAISPAVWAKPKSLSGECNRILRWCTFTPFILVLDMILWWKFLSIKELSQICLFSKFNPTICRWTHHTVKFMSWVNEPRVKECSQFIHRYQQGQGKRQALSVPAVIKLHTRTYDYPNQTGFSSTQDIKLKLHDAWPGTLCEA